MAYFFGFFLFTTSLFLILLILVQRGRGGGLSGAFGGAGGQSAFGTKAGDVFTRITMFVAGFWILLSIASIFFLNDRIDSDAISKKNAELPSAGGSGGDPKDGDPKDGLPKDALPKDFLKNLTKDSADKDSADNGQVLIL